MSFPVNQSEVIGDGKITLGEKDLMKKQRITEGRQSFELKLEGG